MERRLAAILAADVVGYSRLIEMDEAGTLAVLKERRKSILGAVVGEHHGRIVNVMGDGVLVEFASAVNAVACAVELQSRMAVANDVAPYAACLRVGCSSNSRNRMLHTVLACPRCVVSRDCRTTLRREIASFSRWSLNGAHMISSCAKNSSATPMSIFSGPPDGSAAVFAVFMVIAPCN